MKKKFETSESVIVPEIDSAIILTYNDFGKELIIKSNEVFKNTKVEIPLKDSGEVPNMYTFKRLALITIIYNNPQLESLNIWPITPLQSEELLEESKLPKSNEYWEDLALILYDTKGSNKKEANALYKSLQKNKDQLGLSESNLQERLLIVNAGLEKDKSMQYGVKPIVLPGLTQVYPHETLKQTGTHRFRYGLKYGLPSVNELGKGDRILYMPYSDSNLGLRCLYRERDLDLYSNFEDLAGSNVGGRVNLARQKLM